MFRGTNIRERETFLAELTDDPSRRREFLFELGKREITSVNLFGLHTTPLLVPKDLTWLLEVSPAGKNANEKLNEETWWSIISIIYDPYNAEHFDAVYYAAEKWPTLRSKYSFWYDGVSLDSQAASDARRNHQMLESYRGQNRPPPITPPPSQRIEELLQQFEKGNWQAWWRLNLQLTISDDSHFYGQDIDYSIAEMPGWKSASETTRKRILSAAGRYLVVAKPSSSRKAISRIDLAAYRALVLLKKESDTVYDCIDPQIWTRWARAIVAAPKDSSSTSLEQKDVFRDALSKAPKQFVRAVRLQIQAERERAASSKIASDFFILRELDGCWEDDALKAGLYAELLSGRNSGDQFAGILDALVAAHHAPAKSYASKIIKGTRAATEDETLGAAIVLMNRDPNKAWPFIQKLFSRRRAFARRFFFQLAHRSRFESSSLHQLAPKNIAELYLTMQKLFPQSADPRHPPGKAHFVGERELVVHLRDGLLRQLVSVGNEEAVHALRHLVSKLPELGWLYLQLREAEHVMRIKTWAPLDPGDLLRLFRSSNCHLVNSPNDIREILISALARYESELHGEQSPVRALWDRQKSGSIFRPLEEDGISDHVKLFLQRELIENGIIANREVEISRVPGAPVGKRTDIRIDALRRLESGAFDTITAIIETKGCWNPGLFTSLYDQLYKRYMLKVGASVGIYLVGWFHKEKWDKTDPRKRATRNLRLEDVKQRLDREASKIPSGFLVGVSIVSCEAPGT